MYTVFLGQSFHLSFEHQHSHCNCRLTLTVPCCLSWNTTWKGAPLENPFCHQHISCAAMASRRFAPALHFCNSIILYMGEEAMQYQHLAAVY